MKGKKAAKKIEARRKWYDQTMRDLKTGNVKGFHRPGSAKRW